MRRFTLILAGLVLPLGEALAGSWMVGGNIGNAMGDTDASALNSQLTELGLNATASSSNSNRTAWQLYLGYQYTPEWGAEIGYVDLGQVKTTFSGSVEDIDAFLIGVSDIHPQTAQGWQVSATYRYPIYAGSLLIFRAGLLNWRSDYKLATTSVSRTVKDSGVSSVFGLGIAKELVKNTQFSLNYARYSISGEAISVLDAGIAYSFN